MKIQFVISSLFFAFYCAAQTPGGVMEFSDWFRPEIKNDILYLEELQSKKRLISTDIIKHGNYNPLIAASASLRTPFHLDRAPKTIFSITRSENPDEQIIWHLACSDASEYILTNYRMADLSSDSYIAFDQHKARQLVMTTYVLEQTHGQANPDAHFNLGHTFRTDIPVDHWQGAFGDIIFYDRILTFEEQCRIESMLAIKYGINKSNSRSPHYLNAGGNIIWDGLLWNAYCNDIAGIGRDDASGLYQSISASTQDEFPLTMSLVDGNEKIANETFLIWGHNGEPIEVLESENELIPLSRKYLVQLSNWNVKQSTTIELDLSTHPLHLSDDENIWLAVDKTATGNFLPSKTSFYSGKSNGTHISFDPIQWDLDSSGAEGFTFYIAPEEFIFTAVDGGTCSSDTQSTLHWQVIGLSGHLTVTGPNGFHLILAGEKARQGSMALPAHGLYTLSLTGTDGQLYTKTCWTTSRQSYLSKLPQHITLEENEVLVFDPAVYHITNYNWLDTDGNRMQSLPLEVKEAGNYYFTYTQDDCEFIHQLSVTKKEAGNAITCQVFPNPIIDDFFQLLVTIPKKQSITVELFNIAGDRLSQHKYHGRKSYSIKEKINQSPGNYLLKIYTDDASSTKKLIVLEK